MFRQQLDRVHKYVWWREETRGIVCRFNYFLHCVTRELASRYTADGLLAHEAQFYTLGYQAWLSWFETRDEAAVRRAVAEATRRLSMFAAFAAPDNLGHRPVEGASAGADANGAGSSPAAKGVVAAATAVGGIATTDADGRGTWTGVACCSGVVEGTARVVLSPAELSAVSAGELLVIPYSNPSWVALFGLAGGLVIERGGLMSHGAVIAREVGIPTVIQVRLARGCGSARVVNFDFDFFSQFLMRRFIELGCAQIPGITAAIATGDLVRVNGTTGVVEVVLPAASRERRGNGRGDGGGTVQFL